MRRGTLRGRKEGEKREKKQGHPKIRSSSRFVSPTGGTGRVQERGVDRRILCQPGSMPRALSLHELPPAPKKSRSLHHLHGPLLSAGAPAPFLALRPPRGAVHTWPTLVVRSFPPLHPSYCLPPLQTSYCPPLLRPSEGPPVHPTWPLRLPSPPGTGEPGIDPRAPAKQLKMPGPIRP
ncbi:hypothetical protein NDU88_000444 [Pleurodeles waltl]|uniref:Uncharacterized protein n=1 Tax=Pleurodeles waltl TaxID=8319 RepID=A0AAV7Q374_PLEWA|nr:hypothetical protein NDU88_000444 [Pleurodeles waltl]